MQLVETYPEVAENLSEYVYRPRFGSRDVERGERREGKYKL
jgi:hypothetical protein